eukprot:snap_masked-scaffold_4-processed-gene-13.21-mRNA-1 protein AED:1.00 eAED:1.00 QI:0/-1/0/0/-1/1/1/0/59
MCLKGSKIVLYWGRFNKADEEEKSRMLNPEKTSQFLVKAKFDNLHYNKVDPMELSRRGF